MCQNLTKRIKSQLDEVRLQLKPDETFIKLDTSQAPLNEEMTLNPYIDNVVI